MVPSRKIFVIKIIAMTFIIVAIIIIANISSPPKVNIDADLPRGEIAQADSKQRGGGMGPGMGPGMGRGRNMPTFADFDMDGDGWITEKEFEDGRNQRRGERAKAGYLLRGVANAPSFADIDTDDDEKISPDEFAKHQLSRLGQSKP